MRGVPGWSVVAGRDALQPPAALSTVPGWLHHPVRCGRRVCGGVLRLVLVGVGFCKHGTPATSTQHMHAHHTPSRLVGNAGMRVPCVASKHIRDRCGMTAHMYVILLCQYAEGRQPACCLHAAPVLLSLVPTLGSASCVSQCVLAALEGLRVSPAKLAHTRLAAAAARRGRTALCARRRCRHGTLDE